MSTKGSIVKKALTQLRISGLTVQPSPEFTESGLDILEDMMSQLEGANLCFNFNYEELPNSDTQTGVLKKFDWMMVTNLAYRLIAPFNKKVPPSLVMAATGSLAAATSNLATDEIKNVEYPGRMPIGQGNTLRYTQRRNYYIEVVEAPKNCSTHNMIVGETNDFFESFKAYLISETITSYDLVVTEGLTIVSDSNATPDILFRIQADRETLNGQLKITITTSSGRVEVRIVYFTVLNDGEA